MRRWALVGAEQRLLEIASEAAAIHRQFPELRERAESPSLGPRRTPAAIARRRRKMTAAAKKVVSDRMKKYWAERRKKK
jgi:hypothetical protein